MPVNNPLVFDTLQVDGGHNQNIGRETQLYMAP